MLLIHYDWNITKEFPVNGEYHDDYNAKSCFDWKSLPDPGLPQ